MSVDKQQGQRPFGLRWIVLNTVGWSLFILLGFAASWLVWELWERGGVRLLSNAEVRLLVSVTLVAVCWGAIVGWIDMTAAMAGQRHCGREVVTAGIDSLVFRQPIRIGDHVILKAAVNYVSRSSMEVGVRVFREDPYSAEQVLATTAHLTLVVLDENKKPIAAPPLLPQTPEEKRRYENARQRVRDRKERLKALHEPERT